MTSCHFAADFGLDQSLFSRDEKATMTKIDLQRSAVCRDTGIATAVVSVHLSTLRLMEVHLSADWFLCPAIPP